MNADDLPSFVPLDARLALADTMPAYAIDTPERIAAFIGQLAHESACFTTAEENLNYGAPGLLRVWPKRFTPAEAVEFAHDKRRIAERVYGGRNGNGPEGSGDGHKYRGRGWIQITGRANYRRYGGIIGADIEADPDMVFVDGINAAVCCAYWHANGLNELADEGRHDTITRRINGGMNGYNERLEWIRRAT